MWVVQVCFCLWRHITLKYQNINPTIALKFLDEQVVPKALGQTSAESSAHQKKNTFHMNLLLGISVFLKFIKDYVIFSTF